MSELGWLFKLRAWCFVLVVGTSVVLIGAVLALLFWLPLRWIWRMVNGWCHFFLACCRWIVGVRFRVRGREHIPDRGVIYFAKHQSTWETLAFQTLFPHYVWIVKKEAKRIPFFGWGLNSLQPIWIDREAGRSAVEQICDQGGERLRDGIGVLIFPEGTRVAVGQTLPFKMGGALLAASSGAPVVPIAHNAGLFWPAKRLFFVRSGTIDVVVGEPIDPTDQSPEQINRQAEEWINTTVRELDQRPL